MKTTIVAILAACALALASTGCDSGMHIKSVKPSSGVLAGNETIEIRGSGFKSEQGVTVYFGTQRSPTAFVEGTTKVVVTTPPYTKSTLVDIRIISDDGEEIVLKQGFKYLKQGKWTPLDAFGSKRK